MISDIIEDVIQDVFENTIGVFSPLDLSPLAWWDASDEDTITLNGSDVSKWDDKSGNVYHLPQATGSYQPSLEAEGIRFQGSYLESVGNNFADVATTTFLVVKDISISSTRSSYYFGFNNVTISTSRYFGHTSPINLYYTGANIVQPDTSEKTIFMINEDGNSKVRYNNSQVSNITRALMTGNANYTVGAAYLPSDRTREDTYIYEIIVFPGLTEEQISLVYSYLLAKWSI